MILSYLNQAKCLSLLHARDVFEGPLQLWFHGQQVNLQIGEKWK